MPTQGRTLIVALLTLAAFTGTAGAAKPASGLKLVGTDVRAITSDGERYVAFQQAAKVTTLDTETGRRYTATAPAGCSMNLGGEAHNLAFPSSS